MLFNKNVGLPTMATLLSLAGLGRADDCLDAPSVPGTFIGVGFSDSKQNLYNCDTRWKVSHTRWLLIGVFPSNVIERMVSLLPAWRFGRPSGKSRVSA
jgi:hypothetical protein